MTPTFFVSLVLNSLVILIANALFPAQVVLGNANSNLWWAVFHSMVMLTLIGTLAVPLFEWKQKMLGRALTTKEWMIGYLAINFVGVWVITRFSEQFGLGISGWWVGLLLAVAFGFVQSKGMMKVFKKEK
ncbi:MAG: hypothetical protein UX08_C0003G0086 [Candidatus Collierbacteria bacterium GW2011_GWB1_45_35]|uniref:Uncharacterized protein n=2 Tax=Candidatus Collieribacteriota TaxID=1752725 RepID=A0A0G1KSY0_9BACT|nr:MAG: hypothetical protein UW48_C0006G0036 [Microgenomates group bacterium GW2011_GWC1_44_23]KKT86600.1 MAG: hypothetical protein UW84_C0007G0009 [Candidatus Collierbacteria bacterium GW2011_GWA2_44_99]KKT96009.1 MAG: hypothetical protein UW96_C0002G0036 [Candidatus Collierbacteria bacterium GW2011_GWA1_45_15]KKU01118.1 MAG: hypothetical protein UX01_C0002G0084 [Candidatus Collierbacteria bacterium GW2011_GWB2_45_17]KKU05730.1 MAG: hypothetical protein UX08_C0003G0086 [Candidatus Collierbacte